MTNDLSLFFINFDIFEDHCDIICRMNDLDALKLEIGIQFRLGRPRNHTADHISGEIQFEQTEFLVNMNHREGVPRKQPLP